MVKFGNPKVLLLDVPNEAIPAGNTHKVKWQGKKLSESIIANSLPVLGVIISNTSTQTIRLIINESEQSSLKIVAGATQAFSGYPVTDLSIRNEGSEEIAAGEISLNLMNDTEECLRFITAKKAGVVPYA